MKDYNWAIWIFDNSKYQDNGNPVCITFFHDCNYLDIPESGDLVSYKGTVYLVKSISLKTNTKFKTGKAYLFLRPMHVKKLDNI